MLFACNSGTREPSLTTEPTLAQTSLPDTGTYAYYGNGDTIVLNLDILDNTISGDLYYHLKEKDRNSGTIEGYMQDSIFRGLYRYLSEGVVSYREVAFVVRKGQLTEGTGPQINNGDTFVFRHPHALDYTNEPILKKQ